MPILTEGDFPPSGSGRAEPDGPAAEQQGDTSSPLSNKYARRGNIVFIGGGAVVVIGLSVLGGLAYFDASRTSPPKPVAEKLTSPPIGERPSPPAVVEKQTVVAPSLLRGDTKTAAPLELPADSSAKPASPGALADNPPKPPEPIPPPQPQSPPTSSADTPPTAIASPQSGESRDLRQANGSPPVAPPVPLQTKSPGSEAVVEIRFPEETQVKESMGFYGSAASPGSNPASLHAAPSGRRAVKADRDKIADKLNRAELSRLLGGRRALRRATLR